MSLAAYVGPEPAVDVALFAVVICAVGCASLAALVFAPMLPRWVQITTNVLCGCTAAAVWWGANLSWTARAFGVAGFTCIAWNLDSAMRARSRAGEQGIEAELARVNRELGLSMEPQDWGIVNGCGERLAEFCSHLRTRRDLRIETRYQLAELVLASANEALLVDPGAQLADVTDLIRDDPEAFALELPYWRGLGGEEFPIAARL